MRGTVEKLNYRFIYLRSASNILFLTLSLTLTLSLDEINDIVGIKRVLKGECY